MAVFIRRIGWVDIAGDVRTTQLTGNASMAAVETALLNLTNADAASESEAQVFVNSAPTPINATFVSVVDVASLWYSTATGRLIQVSLVAPRLAVFMADGETVDPASVAGLNATVIGVLTTLDGDPATAFVGGRRGRS